MYEVSIGLVDSENLHISQAKTVSHKTRSGDSLGTDTISEGVVFRNLNSTRSTPVLPYSLDVTDLFHKFPLDSKKGH